MNTLQICFIAAVVLFLISVYVLEVNMRNYKKAQIRNEYLSLQALKPKLQKYNMRLHEVSEGLYQVVQYAKVSDKPVFQLTKSRKGIQYIKLSSNELSNSKSTLMSASYLNKVLV